MTSGSLIELEAVSVGQDGRGRGPMPLRGLTLRVDEGASLGLVGPNGSGKSTVLRVLAALVRPTAGRALVAGFDTRHHAAQVRRRIGYVPEQFGVYPRLSIGQYLDFFARASGVSQWERKNTVETMLRVVDLFDARHAAAEALSRGARRRLGLARALLHNPPILLLDDPLGGLDGRGRLELLEVLKEVRGMGITLLVATHLLGDLAQLCDSVAVLREGRLVGMLPLAVALGRGERGRRRIRVELLDGVEQASAALRSQSGVLDVSEAERELRFVYEGDASGLADVVARLVQGGARVTEFGGGTEHLDELAAALAEGDAWADASGPLPEPVSA